MKGGQHDITVVLVEVEGEGARVVTDTERASFDTAQPMAPAMGAAAPAVLAV